MKVLTTSDGDFDGMVLALTLILGLFVCVFVCGATGELHVPGDCLPATQSLTLFAYCQPSVKIVLFFRPCKTNGSSYLDGPKPAPVGRWCYPLLGLSLSNWSRISSARRWKQDPQFKKGTLQPVALNHLAISRLLVF